MLAVRRRGKQLWLELGDTRGGGCTGCLLLHFGMTGAVIVRGVAAPLYKSVDNPDPNPDPTLTLSAGLAQSLDALIEHSDETFARQISYILEQLSAPPAEDGDQAQSGDEDGEEEEEEAEEEELEEEGDDEEVDVFAEAALPVDSPTGENPSPSPSPSTLGHRRGAARWPWP